MTQQDARERAWEAEDAHFADQQIPQHASRAVVKAWWWAGWDAAKQEDEERIAALVDRLERAMQLLAYGNFKNGNTDPTGTLDEGEVLAGRMYDELRALADQKEAERGGAR